MNKLYSVHDHWTDIAKKNDVNIESIDGVITGIKVNGEDYGGGGSSWQTVFEGSVTTEADAPAPNGTIQNIPLTANTIKVTFNGTEYECGKYANGSYGAPFDEDTEQFDFSDYPFGIGVVQVAGNPTAHIDVYTETAGTYTLKIEEPQSGGTSDFSTATMTVNGNFTTSDLFIAPVIEKYPNNEDVAFPLLPSGNRTYTVILYKGRSVLMFMGSRSRHITVSGNIETSFESGDTVVYIITGDCTITIS